MEAQEQSSDAEAARLAEARALASAELLRRENRSTWEMLDEKQQAIQRLEVHPPELPASALGQLHATEY